MQDIKDSVLQNDLFCIYPLKCTYAHWKQKELLKTSKDKRWRNCPTDSAVPLFDLHHFQAEQLLNKYIVQE